MAARVYRGLAALAAVVAAGCGEAAREAGGDRPAAGVRVSETRPRMGVAWTITVHAPDRASGERALAAGFAEVTRLERIFSDYDPDSELSRLSATTPTPAPVEVGTDLWNVLERSQGMHRLSGGAFDITVGPLTTLWRQSRRSGHLPRPDKLAAARAATGGDGLVLDPEAHTAMLSKPGMRLDPGGIGMGYAADRVLELFARQGIASAMVDASGDVAVSEPPPSSDGWRIEVRGMPGDNPADDVIVLAHAAITTSGDARQFVEIDGRRYSHVVDPRTGLGVPGPAAVTVIAPDATTADALATAASVAGPEAGAELVARVPGASARFIWRDGETLQTRVTAGWPRP